MNLVWRHKPILFLLLFNAMTVEHRDRCEMWNWRRRREDEVESGVGVR